MCVITCAFITLWRMVHRHYSFVDAGGHARDDADAKVLGNPEIVDDNGSTVRPQSPINVQNTVDSCVSDS